MIENAWRVINISSLFYFLCVQSFLKYLLFLMKLSFSDTTVIEGGRERKHSWDLSLLFGRYLRDIVSLITHARLFNGSRYL